MALDQQRNWDISMAENLDQIQRKSWMSEDAQIPSPNPTLAKTTSTNAWTGESVYLPDEILIQILNYVATERDQTLAQRTLASVACLSRQWNAVAIPLLYRCPQLYGKNFDLFVRTIVTSKNIRVRESPLSRLVHTLYMGGLVHQGSKSMTAKLLGRTADNLKHFTAPVASFGVNCLAPLARCHELQYLDLSLVSETPPLPEILKATSSLNNLKVFRLPRSSGFGIHFKSKSFVWPPNVEDLTLSGGIDEHFLRGVVPFPTTLRHLTVEHCPLAKGFTVVHLLRNCVRPLPKIESLKLRHLPRLGSRALDDVLILVPQLRKLSVSVDYVTPAFLDEAHFHHEIKPFLLENGEESDQALTLLGNSLSILELTNSGNPGAEDKLMPIDILIALDEGTVPKLRKVRVAKTLHWSSSAIKTDSDELGDALQEASKRDWESNPDLFPFRGDRQEQERRRVWEAVAGVWEFDE